MKFFFYAFIFGLSLFLASCGAQLEEEPQSIVTPPGTFPIVTEDLEMTFMLHKTTQLDKDWNQNEASLFMEDLTGIKINYKVVEDPIRQRQLSIASDTLPDAFMGATSSADIMTNGPGGVYLPLNDLIEGYAPNIKKNFNEYPLYKKIITTPDGTIYSLLSINDDLHGSYGQKTWINRTWLDALGLAMPQTTEEFKQVLIAFRDGDPNGNGKADEIPWTGSVTGWFSSLPGALVNAFLYVNPLMEGLYLDNGKVRSAYQQDEYKDALAFAAELYKEDLIDPNAFTQNLKELVSLAEKEGDNILGAVEGGYWGIFTRNGGKSGRYKEYDLVPPLLGPYGVRTSGFHIRIVNNAFTLTKDCKSPEAAIRWADYIATPEGAWNTQFGLEGKGWVRPPEGALGLNGEPALFVRLFAQETNSNWGFDPVIPRFQPAEQRLGEMRAEPEEFYEPSKLMTRLIGEMEKYTPYKPPEEMIMPPVYMTEEQTAAMSSVHDDIMDYINESTFMFITGARDLENEWGDYINTLKEMGMGKLLSVYQEAYDLQFGQ